jgi:hypothetical protein
VVAAAGSIQQPLAQALGWSLAERQSQGQQFEGGLEFVHPLLQAWALPEQGGQLFTLGGIEVAQGVPRQQGVEVALGGVIGWIHGSLLVSISNSRNRIRPCRERVLTVPRGSCSRWPIAD